MSAQVLNIVECRNCGSTHWQEGPSNGGTIEAGPCCFGHFVLDIENYPTAYMARKNWLVFIKRRNEAIQKRTTETQRHREEVKA